MLYRVNGETTNREIKDLVAMTLMSPMNSLVIITFLVFGTFGLNGCCSPSEGHSTDSEILIENSRTCPMTNEWDVAVPLEDIDQVAMDIVYGSNNPTIVTYSNMCSVVNEYDHDCLINQYYVCENKL